MQAICAHVHQHLRFRYGSTTPLSTAADVDASGFGVCRDFAHLAISFCRALNIPARYVSDVTMATTFGGPSSRR